ncbi:MAG: Csu type fimbrial protein [Sphingomonadaceae bacterium]
MCRKTVLAGATTILALLEAPVVAQTATTQFDVQITITEECQINSADDLNFGSTGVLDANIDGTNAIRVQCTNGTTYNIGLNAGTGTGATVATRLMTGAGAATVQYSLYRNAARTQVWGETIGTDTVSSTGTGAEQTFTVYGRVPTQTTPAPNTYNDIVTATVTY